MTPEAWERKQRRREQRRRRVEAREARWIAAYEANQARVLGDPDYKLPKAGE